MTAVSVPDLLQDLLGVVPAGCDHAEARVVVRDSEAIGVRNGAVEWLETEASAGLGVRVRSGGAWGFAATAEMTPAAARGALARAIAVAEAQPRPAAGRRAWAATVTGVTPATGTWASPCAQDPFAVSVDAKLEHLLGAEAAMAGDPRIARREASCLSVRTHVTFASTAGALCEQTIVHCGGGLEALAVDGDEAQLRSYPSGHGGSVAAAGWEHLLGLDLAANAPRVAEEAVALLTAPVCPAGPVTLVLRRRAARAAGPRVDRPRARARPHARRRGVVRGHELDRAFGHRLAALRLGAHARHGRRDAARRPGHVRLGRRGRGGAAHDARRRRDPAGRAVGPDVRRRHRARASRAAARAPTASRASRSSG